MVREEIMGALKKIKGCKADGVDEDPFLKHRKMVPLVIQREMRDSCWERTGIHFQRVKCL